MIRRTARAAGLCLVAVSATACVSPDGETPQEQLAYARAMHDVSLAEANTQHPDLAAAMASAPGYVVLDSFVCKIFFIGTSNGYGVLVDNRDKSVTVIDHFTLALGIGIEVARLGGVLVINDAAAVDELKAGVVDFGGDAELAFEFGDFGGALRALDTGPATTHYPTFGDGVAIHASVFWAFISRNNLNPAPEKAK